MHFLCLFLHDKYVYIIIINRDVPYWLGIEPVGDHIYHHVVAFQRGTPSDADFAAKDAEIDDIYYITERRYMQIREFSLLLLLF